MEFVLNFIITFVAYMILPFILFKVMKKQYSKKKTFIINFINSIIMMAFFIALRNYLGISQPVSTSGPAMFYLMINSFLYPTNNNQKSAIRNPGQTTSNKKEETNKKRKSKKKIILISIISTIVVALSVSNIIFIIKFYNFQKEIIKKNETIKEQHKNYLELLGTNISILQGKEKEYIIDKLNFFDNYIVFVIDGYGNYYSDYDCTMQRVGNNEYKFWAFNIATAKSQGYKEYKCK